MTVRSRLPPSAIACAFSVVVRCSFAVTNRHRPARATMAMIGVRDLAAVGVVRFHPEASTRAYGVGAGDGCAAQLRSHA
jgi:hypothetical protein